MLSKNILTCFLLFVSLNALNAQVTLSTQPLELRHNSMYYQSMVAPEGDNKELVVFAADRDKVTALRYNGVVFFTDSLTAPRPHRDYEFMAGYSFAPNKTTYAYWASSNYKKIEALGFNFESKITSAVQLSIPLEKEEILTTFSVYNSFYIVTLPEEKNQLKFYIFDSGRYETRIADFANITIEDYGKKKMAIHDLLDDYPLQYMDTKSFNDLVIASNKVKLMVLKDEILLTTDHNPGVTQIFSIDPVTFAVTQMAIRQPSLAKAGETNSYYNNGVLYQYKLNEEQMALQATDVVSGDLIKNYIVNSADSIAFRNSPLYIQTGNQKPRELKDTRKFLKRAADSNLAISVYQTPDDVLITMGGVRSVVPAGNLLLGVAVAAAGVSPDELFDAESTQTLYFEGLFDENLVHQPYQPGALALDYLGQFMAAERNLTLQNVVPFDDYLVLGYYDNKAKQYVLRKFKDEDF